LAEPIAFSSARDRSCLVQYVGQVEASDEKTAIERAQKEFS
jgi:hypothetical protein